MDTARLDNVNAVQEMNSNLLPAKSQDRYITVYDNFITWKNEKDMNSFSENVLLAYFEEIAGKYKPSSLWAIYSMLKNTLKSKNCVNIDQYMNLTAFLKKQSDGYMSKKSKILTEDNVEKFINEAPDDRYLATKVALILGVTGALRRQELSEITTHDIENHGELLLIKVPHTRRSFIIQGEHCDIVKKYQNLRTKKGSSSRFFQQFRNGKCTAQLIGKNKFGAMPKEIAEYLNLPDSKSYTGHSFRRTSATLLADSGADVIAFKRHGGWKSHSVPERYIHDSRSSKHQIGPTTDSIVQASVHGQSGPSSTFANMEAESRAESNITIEQQPCTSDDSKNFDFVTAGQEISNTNENLS